MTKYDLIKRGVVICVFLPDAGTIILKASESPIFNRSAGRRYVCLSFCADDVLQPEETNLMRTWTEGTWNYLEKNMFIYRGGV